jgi:hypothetical protein
MAYELAYLPGRFSDGVAGFVGPLVRGTTAVRLLSLVPETGPGAAALRDATPEAAGAWLAAVATGELRACKIEVAVFGKRAHGALACRGAKGDRALAHLLLAADGPLAPSDAETALLAPACAALAREAQGAALIGYGLGDPAEYGGEGTVAEQVRAADAALGGRLLGFVAAPDTARALGDFAGFHPAPLGNLAHFRRTAPV